MRRNSTLWNINLWKPACLVRWGTLLRKYELARELTYGKQQLLWQKQVTVGLIGSIDLDSWIDE